MYEHPLTPLSGQIIWFERIAFPQAMSVVLETYRQLDCHPLEAGGVIGDAC